MVLNWKLNFSLRFLSRTLSLMAVWAHSEESWLCWEWTRIVLKFTDEFVKFFHRQCFWLKFAWNSCKIHHYTWEADWKVHHETWWADCKFTSTHGKKSLWVTSAHHKKSFVKEDLIRTSHLRLLPFHHFSPCKKVSWQMLHHHLNCYKIPK